MEVGKTLASAGAWAWDQFGDNVKPGFLAFLKRKWEDVKEEHEKLRYTEAKWNNFSWGQAAERYKKHMQEIYGHIRVIGTTGPNPIGDIFTDVHILNKPQAYRRFDFTRLPEIQEEPEKLDDGKRRRGLQVVISKSGHRLYILGNPGSGKTTFLKYLVHQTIIAGELDKLPIFVTLRDWNPLSTGLMDFISAQFDICYFPDALPFIEYLLESGKAIVLFDGLDEVPQEFDQRGQTIQALHDFSKKYLEAQIVITCRVAASDYSFTEFTYVEMADFSEKQVETYARNWFRNTFETAKDFLKELNMEENRGVRDLGRSPLLLSMICLAYEETLTIPKRRAELYEEALDALLKKWDSGRKIKRDQTYKQLSLGHKRQMFAEIAANYFDKGEIFFQKKELAQKIETYLSYLPPDSTNETPDGETILETISAQHGILVERARGIYSFSHLTFQEYYTAKYISDNANRETLRYLANHLNDSRWWEVFLLSASLLPEATPLFTAMQKAGQGLLQNHPPLLTNQAWAARRAVRIPVFKDNAKRTLYWFVSLDLARDRARDFDLAFDLDLALTFGLDLDLAFGLDLDLALARALDLARERALGLGLDRDRDLGLGLARDLDLGLGLDLDLDRARERERDRDRTLARTLDRARTLARTLDRARALDRARDLDNALALDRALARDRALDLARALDPRLAQDPPAQAREGLEFFYFVLNTTYLILFAKVFALLPKNEHSMARVDQFQAYLKAWKAMPGNPPGTHKAITCPAYKASDDVWQAFKRSVDEIVEKLLEIDLSQEWERDDYEAAAAYLQANQLIWDCLQVARVEDRAKVEDMILKAPEE